MKVPASILVSGSAAVLLAATLAPSAHAAAPDFEAASAAAFADFRARPVQAAGPAAAWTDSQRAVAEALNSEQRSRRLTRDQYLALRAGGRGLAIAPGQGWMPASVAASVQQAIAFAFDNGMAEELSWRDFWHGHLELDKGTAVDDRFKRLQEGRRAMAASCDVCARYRDYTMGLITSRSGAAAESFPDFVSTFFAGSCSFDSFKDLYVDQLQALAAHPAHHILYHTRETFENAGALQRNRTIVVDAQGRAVKDPQAHHGGDDATSEPDAGSLTVSFFVNDAGELVFYPAEDKFIMLRSCMRIRDAEPPF